MDALLLENAAFNSVLGLSLSREILSGDQTEAVCQSAGPISLQPFGFSGGNAAMPRESSPYVDESQQGQSEARAEMITANKTNNQPLKTTGFLFGR